MILSMTAYLCNFIGPVHLVFDGSTDAADGIILDIDVVTVEVESDVVVHLASGPGHGLLFQVLVHAARGSGKEQQRLLTIRL